MHLCHVGWGWGGCNNVHGNLNIRHATLWDLLLHWHTYVMPRCRIFSCTGTHTSCHAVGSSLALAHIRHATLWDLLLHWHTYVMLRCAFLTVRLPNIFLVWAFRPFSLVYPDFLFFRPGLFLCLVLSNFHLNLLISTAALELQLSKRCPTWPHPRHVRGIRS